MRRAGHRALYSTVRDKLLSPAETVQFFPRLDPYPGSLGSFPAQMALIFALIGIVGWNIRGRSIRGALRTPVAAVALVLAAVAVLDPISNVNDLTKLDQRLLLPAILLLLAALPWKRARIRSTVAVAGVVATTLTLHGVTLVSLDAPLQRAFDAIDATIPDNAAVATLAVPADGGCGPQPGPSIGIPSLKWFDVYRMLAHHEVRPSGDLRGRAAVRPDRRPRTHVERHERIRGAGGRRRHACDVRRGLCLSRRSGPCRRRAGSPVRSGGIRRALRDLSRRALSGTRPDRRGHSNEDGELLRVGDQLYLR